MGWAGQGQVSTVSTDKMRKNLATHLGHCFPIGDRPREDKSLCTSGVQDLRRSKKQTTGRSADGARVSMDHGRGSQGLCLVVCLLRRWRCQRASFFLEYLACPSPFPVQVVRALNSGNFSRWARIPVDSYLEEFAMSNIPTPALPKQKGKGIALDPYVVACLLAASGRRYRDDESTTANKVMAFHGGQRSAGTKANLRFYFADDDSTYKHLNIVTLLTSFLQIQIQ